MAFGLPFYGSITITLSKTYPFIKISFSSVCYASGTLIRTTRGDIPVEQLAIGDLAITASGQARPIVWLGHRHINCSQGEARDNAPVRISANTFGPSKPGRDLYVSPGHAICVDIAGEILIPAASLVNGSNIVRTDMDEVTYWHVELESHDILIANGLPAESYIDMGNRAFFVEAGAKIDRADVDPAEVEQKSLTDYCRPLHVRGLLVEAVRAQIAERAAADGWVEDRDADLHLVVDGKAVEPLAAGDSAILVFPAEAKDVRLSAKTFVPADNGGDDPRRLGLSVRGLTVSATDGEPRRISLDEPALADAFYETERENGVAWRWTRGDIVLPRELWEGLSGQVALHLSYESATPRGWIAPPGAEAEPPMLRIVA